MALADPSNFFVNPKSIHIKYASKKPENHSQKASTGSEQEVSEQSSDSEPSSTSITTQLSTSPLTADPEKNHGPKGFLSSPSPLKQTIEPNREVPFHPSSEPTSEDSALQLSGDRYSQPKAIQNMIKFTKFSQSEEHLSVLAQNVDILTKVICQIHGIKNLITEEFDQSDANKDHVMNDTLGKSIVDKHPKSLLRNSEPGHCLPCRIRHLSPYIPKELKETPLPVEQLLTFSGAFLKYILGGTEWSPGFFLSGESTVNTMRKSFYLANSSVEPCLPLKPGDHGAKLTPFLRPYYEEDNISFNDVPLFIAASKSSDEYIYFGEYSQSVFSDRLDYDRAYEVVSDETRNYWADMILSSDRPQWLTDALLPHIVAPPEYEDNVSDLEAAGNSGPLMPDTQGDHDRATPGAIERAEEFVQGRKKWRAEALSKLNETTKDDILAAFNKEEGGEEPGIRFWWEYLECVGFDRAFYYQLATAQRSWKE